MSPFAALNMGVAHATYQQTTTIILNHWGILIDYATSVERCVAGGCLSGAVLWLVGHLTVKRSSQQKRSTRRWKNMWPQHPQPQVPQAPQGQWMWDSFDIAGVVGIDLNMIPVCLKYNRLADLKNKTDKQKIDTLCPLRSCCLIFSLM